MRGPSVTSRTELRPTLGSMRSLTVAALLAVLLGLGGRWMVESATVFARALGVGDT